MDDRGAKLFGHLEETAMGGFVAGKNQFAATRAQGGHGRAGILMAIDQEVMAEFLAESM